MGKKKGNKSAGVEMNKVMSKECEEPTSTAVVTTSAIAEKMSVVVESPLMNDQILKRIMHWLPDRSLFQCRLVCKKWNRHASEELSKSVFVYFDFEDYGDSYVGIRPFVQIMGMATTPYITRVYFFDIELPSALIMQFFHAYGRHVRHLRLEYSRFSRSRAAGRGQNLCERLNVQWTVRDLRAILLSYVPNLQTLELLGLPVAGRSEAIFDDWFRQESTICETLPHPCLPSSSSWTMKDSVIKYLDPQRRGNCCNLSNLRVESAGRKSRRWSFIEDLIWMSENLEKIELGSGISHSAIIMALEKYGRFGKLKKLAMEDLLFPDLAALARAPMDYGLRLETLEARMCMANISRKSSELFAENEFTGSPQYLRTLEDFIVSQAKSLKVLKITPDTESDVQPRLTGMDQVVELKMSPDQCRIEYFLHPFRNLKKLSLTSLHIRDDYEWNMYFPQVMTSSYRPRVEDLELPYGLQDPLKLKRFRQYFPTLTRLTMRGIEDQKLLIELWTSWRKLEELRVELKSDFKPDSDRVFTGFNEKLMKESFHGESKQQFNPSSSITSLKKLRYLEVLLDPIICHKKYSFGNTFVLMGLLHMPSLRTVLIPKSNIEQRAVDLLLKANPLLTADFDHIECVNRWWTD